MGGFLDKAVRRAVAIVTAAVLVAGCALARAPAPDVYDLQPAAQFEQPGRSGAHLAITEPNAVGALDSERVAVRLSPTQISYLGRAQWSDRLPRLLQRRLIESFQNSDRIRSVGTPGGAVVNDVGMVSDLRVFHVDVPQDLAEVEIEVRLVSDETGRVIASQRFSGQVQLPGPDRQDMVVALNAAFAKVAAEIVVWTLGRI